MPKMILNPEQLILKVARELVKEKGYSAMNVRAISKESGVSIGTIYNYFPDKLALDFKVMNYFWMGYEEQVSAILETDDPILYQIKACYEVLDAHLGQFLELFSLSRSNHSAKHCDSANRKALIERVSLILKDRLLETCVFDETMDASEMAFFIINTHVQIVSYQMYQYDLFEKVLQKILHIK